MKLRKEQILYVHSMRKALRVTAIFESDEETNDYLQKHKDEGVIAEFGKYIFIANLYDSGVKINENS